MYIAEFDPEFGTVYNVIYVAQSMLKATATHAMVTSPTLPA